MGHAIRSSVILEHLTKKHDVYIFSSERAYEFLAEKFDNVFEIGGFNTVYENNKVRTKKTFFKALKANPTNLKEGYNVLYKECKRIKPNIIISDFENYSSMLSKLMNIPLISLDGGIISSFICLSATSTGLSPSKGTLPVSISYITIPRE